MLTGKRNFIRLYEQKKNNKINNVFQRVSFYEIFKRVQNSSCEYQRLQIRFTKKWSEQSNSHQKKLEDVGETV